MLWIRLNLCGRIWIEKESAAKNTTAATQTESKEYVDSSDTPESEQVDQLVTVARVVFVLQLFTVVHSVHPYVTCTETYQNN